MSRRSTTNPWNWISDFKNSEGGQTEKVFTMIIVKENNINKAWRNVLQQLYHDGFTPQDERFFKYDTVVIEMNSPQICDPDPSFPINKENIDIINTFIITGKDEDKVCHEWTKLYYHRLFDEPNSQIEYIIDRIKNNRVGIACNWIKEDQHNEIKPCMLSITATDEHGKLNFQLHARACNAYDKMLMNLQEFITLQQYIAQRCNLELGRFTMFIDYAQIANKDKEQVEQIISK